MQELKRVLKILLRTIHDFESLLVEGLLPKPEGSFAPILVSEDGIMLVYKTSLPVFDANGTDVVKKRFKVTQESNVVFTVDLDLGVSESPEYGVMPGPYTLLMTYIDDADNESLPLEATFVAADTIAPDQPTGDFSPVLIREDN